MLNKKENTTFTIMNKKTYIKKAFLATFLVFAVHVVFAAFTLTGNKNERNSSNKYSLKNLSKYSNRNLSLSSSKYLLRLKPTELHVSPNGTGLNSSIQMSNGNTTFIYPYKMKIKVPKFKTPTSVTH